MDEELTASEKRELELNEFLREFTSIISEKFTKQRDLIDSISREIYSIKNDDIFELKRGIEDLKESVNGLNEKIPTEPRVSKEILDTLRRE